MERRGPIQERVELGGKPCIPCTEDGTHPRGAVKTLFIAALPHHIFHGLLARIHGGEEGGGEGYHATSSNVKQQMR
jgi:hypothetical protein